MTNGDGHKGRLPQATSTIVIVGISQEPEKQTGEDKHCSEQQWFNH